MLMMLKRLINLKLLNLIKEQIDWHFLLYDAIS
jgi:hypothetical protein